ncbi:MAG: glycine--tRNA ligase subunit beta, partial [Pseudomonadota bacterium]
MPDLLIELRSEEIPARIQKRAGADFERLMIKALSDGGLTFDRARHFFGPRRLTLHVEGLPEASPDLREERKGPRVGAPDKAIEGFLRGAGLEDISQARVENTKKGEVYVAIVETKGRPATDVITEALSATIDSFPWPKSQRWGSGSLRWVRPLRGVLLSFDGQSVPLTIANDDQPIHAGIATETHRVLGSGPAEATTFKDYMAALEHGCVVLDAEDRAARIRDGALKLCADAGLELVQDNGLLAEVTGLAEWPTPHLGAFDEKFLALPDEVITAAMRGHQKYFSVRDPKSDRLAPRFVAVADIEASASMLRGYERVLAARLSDALFLYRKDLKTPLAEQSKKLSGVTFFEGLGSLADKSERIASLSRLLAPACGVEPSAAEETARLAKADLTSQMVYEFPELQGLMGRYYAVEEGLSPAYADAIRDHYKPAGPSDDLPTNGLGTAVSLADKLDTLAAFWTIGKKPTGSGDPFALRRAALAVIRLVLEQNLRLSLHAVIKQALEPIPNSGASGSREETLADLIGFFGDRLTVYLREQGHRHDHVAAVMGEGPDDLVLMRDKLQALSAFLDTEEGENLTAAYKRAANILKAEAKKSDLPEASVEPERFEQEEERMLHASLDAAAEQARGALDQEEFGDAMRALANIRAPLDDFFGAVTVNADNPNLRANRLAQLLRFKQVV